MLRFRKHPCTKAVLAALLFPLLGCTKMEIEDHSYQFNEAVGSVDNRLLLLNAVRASKDYPVRFSVLQAYTGSSRWDGTYAPDVPLPIRADRSYKLLPSFDLNPGVESLQLADLNPAKAQRELKNKLTFNDWYYYLSTGRDGHLILNLFVERITIHYAILDRLLANLEAGCNQRPLRLFCEQIDDFARECAKTHGRADAFLKFVGHIKRQPLFVTRNLPLRRCEHKRFQATLGLLIINNFQIETYTFRNLKKEKASGQAEKGKADNVDVNVNVTIGKQGGTQPPKAQIFFAFGDSAIDTEVESMLKSEELDKIGINPFEFSLRSPESMVRYLGEVIAAEAYREPAYVVTAAVRGDGYGTLVPLFPVAVGEMGTRNAAVSVRGPEGDRFSIPIPEHGAVGRHRGLATLGLVQEVIGAAVSNEALPPVRNVIFNPTR